LTEWRGAHEDELTRRARGLALLVVIASALGAGDRLGSGDLIDEHERVAERVRHGT
jgi:hypothetical protein